MRALENLAKIKHEEIQMVLIELSRLEMLSEHAQNYVRQILSEISDYVGLIRASQKQQLIDASQMLSQRRYLLTMHDRLRKAETDCAQVTEQRDRSRETLEHLMIEKKTYEVIVEKHIKVKRSSTERRRLNEMDDDELRRLSRMRKAI